MEYRWEGRHAVGRGQNNMIKEESLSLSLALVFVCMFWRERGGGGWSVSVSGNSWHHGVSLAEKNLISLMIS